MALLTGSAERDQLVGIRRVWRSPPSEGGIPSLEFGGRRLVSEAEGYPQTPAAKYVEL